MEQITLDLQPDPASPRARVIQRMLFGLLGVMNLVQGVLTENSFRYINYIFGVLLIVFVLNYRRIYKPNVYTFDEEGFEGPIGRSDNKRFRWTDVASLVAKLFTLKIFMKSGREVNIYLGNITFHQHKQIKPKILELAQSNGVEVRKA
jgi:hypothetical protein